MKPSEHHFDRDEEPPSGAVRAAAAVGAVFTIAGALATIFFSAGTSSFLLIGATVGVSTVVTFVIVAYEQHSRNEAVHRGGAADGEIVHAGGMMDGMAGIFDIVGITMPSRRVSQLLPWEHLEQRLAEEYGRLELERSDK